jgi:metallothionein
MTTATQTKCACGTCSCEVTPAATIVKDGKNYCSEACANGHPDGKGCGHTGCDCHAA